MCSLDKHQNKVCDPAAKSKAATGCEVILRSVFLNFLSVSSVMRQEPTSATYLNNKLSPWAPKSSHVRIVQTALVRSHHQQWDK